MGVFDRLAGIFKDSEAKAQLARAQEIIQRDHKANMEKRWYDAARTSRATWGWMAGSTSADAEVYGGFVNLRNRSRDLVRNNGFASKSMRVLADNIVGTGIMAVARTGNKRTDDRINKIWNRFCDECDFGGQNNLYGLQRLVVRSVLEGGEAVIRLRTAKANDKSIPLQIQCLEGDYIDHRRNGAIAGHEPALMGIQINRETGKREAYWMFRQHPGEMIYTQPQSYESDLVPADEILHVYESLRLGQMRGVPWFAPGIIDARDIKTYQESERVRKRIEACTVAVVMANDEDQEGIAPMVTDYAGNKIEQFEPGLIAIARGGKDIKFTQPAAASAYHEAMKTDLQSLAASWGLTYELLSGDLSRVNYSSIKAGINEFRRTTATFQTLTLMPLFMIPIWRAVIDRAVLDGKLPKGTPYDVQFTTPKFESVDPVKEVDGDVAQVRALLKSPQEAIIERGYDPDVVLAQTIEWHKKLIAAGITSDADATQVTKVGAPAVTPPGTGSDQT